MIYYTLMALPEKLGLIDTLSAGFGVINKRLWLVALPVGLELLLWLSPKVQATSLVNQAVNDYRQLVLQSGPRLALPEESAEQLFSEVDRLAQTAGKVNLLYVLGWQMHGLMGVPDSVFSSRTPLDLAKPAPLAALLVILAGLGILIACAYLGAIAQLVRQSRFSWRPYLGRIGRNWLTLTTYLLIVLVAALSLGMLALLVIGLVGLASPGLAGLLGAVAISVVLWGMIYLFLAEEAIFISEVSATRAIWYSASIVRRNFWSAVGLFLITNIILLGMSIALSILFLHPLGVVASMTVNAYIASGLAAAAMIFYQQRSGIWLESTLHGPG
ncbi:MAG: hypothetical protein HYX92_20020 [Chloroflexi bacterium]|nr:hypothetical protein [Chloroflexota bacterium]